MTTPAARRQRRRTALSLSAITVCVLVPFFTPDDGAATGLDGSVADVAPTPRAATYRSEGTAAS